ncbi:MAG: hypothetical protein R2684_00570 [Pyrinomonadaceae bacterium]
MDALKLHILFNYYPAIGFIIATLVLTAGMWLRNVGAKRFAMKLFVALAILTFCVAFAGEVASWAYLADSSSRMAALTGHKHFATTAFAATVITGILSLIGLARTRKGQDRGSGFYVTLLLVAIASSVLLMTTILRGRHIKWAVAVPTERSISLSSVDTENKLWHA